MNFFVEMLTNRGFYNMMFRMVHEGSARIEAAVGQFCALTNPTLLLSRDKSVPVQLGLAKLICFSRRSMEIDDTRFAAGGNYFPVIAHLCQLTQPATDEVNGEISNQVYRRVALSLAAYAQRETINLSEIGAAAAIIRTNFQMQDSEIAILDSLPEPIAI